MEALKMHDADCMFQIMQDAFENDILTHRSCAYEGDSATNSTKCGLLLSTNTQHTSLTICRCRYDIKNGWPTRDVNRYTCKPKLPTGVSEAYTISSFSSNFWSERIGDFPRLFDSKHSQRYPSHSNLVERRTTVHVLSHHNGRYVF
jgi:hypothetical protein